MSDKPVLLNEIRDINVIHSLDFKCYQYPLDEEQYASLVNKEAVLCYVLAIKSQNVAFALWERGSKKKPAFVYRLGVVPEIVIDYMGRPKTVVCRRNGYATSLLDRITKDVMDNKKSGLERTLQMVLSANICLGPNDKDDVSGFMSKSGFTWVNSHPDAFFEYGKKTEGLVFERKLQ